MAQTSPPPAAAHALPQGQRGIVLFAHGSRDPRWQQPIEAVSTRVRQMDPHAHCLCAYLELSSPDLATATADLVAAGCLQVTVLPMFLGTGRHAREDLPVLVQQLASRYPGVHFHVATPVGEDPRVTALLGDMARQYIL